MIIRSLNYEELPNFKWKMYPLEVTNKIKKEDIIKLTEGTKIKTNELHFNEYYAYIDTLGTDIIIITDKGEKVFTKYNHVFKGNKIYIKIDGRWETWGKIKKNITKIYFMDSLIYHEKVRNLWSEKGFSFTKFYNDIQEELIQELKDNIK